MSERLQNVLAHAGVASRRHAAEIISEGRVTVDGLVVREAGVRVEPTAKIVVDGRAIAAAEAKRTIMLYKPVGVLSSMSDPFGGRTVADLLRGKVSERLVPVGRLDKDSEGLLLMSNDGDLVLRLTHPRYEHEKTYVVRVAGRWSEEKLKVLRGPVKMPDGYETRPVPVAVKSKSEKVESGRVEESGEDSKRTTARFAGVSGEGQQAYDNKTGITTLEFRLREGRKRQIRYMCSAAHLVVVSLKRVAVGGVKLDAQLAPGEWRDLTAGELSALSNFSNFSNVSNVSNFSNFSNPSNHEC